MGSPPYFAAAFFAYFSALSSDGVENTLSVYFFRQSSRRFPVSIAGSRYPPTRSLKTVVVP
ncbi:MAG: hypothetical protein ACI4XF_09680 [Oscillospiraceae bacterium]